MSRKRDEFIPLGDVAEAVELSGDRALASRAVAPLARRHFTRLDQVAQLVGVSEADPELGSIARLLALCSLPRTNPGNRTQYVRRNGPYTLVMSCASTVKLPYGPLPRLLLAWVTTEAVRTQNPVLVLEDSLSAFMRKLGLESSGGAGRIRLRNQMDRLFNAAVSLTYEDEHGKRFMSSTIAEGGEFWWNFKRPEERSLWESKTDLGVLVLSPSLPCIPRLVES